MKFYEPEFNAAIEQYKNIRSAKDTQGLQDFIARRRAETVARLEVRIGHAIAPINSVSLSSSTLLCASGKLTIATPKKRQRTRRHVLALPRKSFHHLCGRILISVVPSVSS